MLLHQPLLVWIQPALTELDFSPPCRGGCEGLGAGFPPCPSPVFGTVTGIPKTSQNELKSQLFALCHSELNLAGGFSTRCDYQAGFCKGMPITQLYQLTWALAMLPVSAP